MPSSWRSWGFELMFALAHFFFFFFFFQKVKIFTSHCDPAHSFPETQDGTLDVTVVGDFLPRHFCHRGYALFAYLRMLYVSMYVTLFHSADVGLIFVFFFFVFLSCLLLDCPRYFFSSSSF